MEVLADETHHMTYKLSLFSGLPHTHYSSNTLKSGSSDRSESGLPVSAFVHVDVNSLMEWISRKCQLF